MFLWNNFENVDQMFQTENRMYGSQKWKKRWVIYPINEPAWNEKIFKSQLFDLNLDSYDRFVLKYKRKSFQEMTTRSSILQHSLQSIAGNKVDAKMDDNVMNSLAHLDVFPKFYILIARICSLHSW